MIGDLLGVAVEVDPDHLEGLVEICPVEPLHEIEDHGIQEAANDSLYQVVLNQEVST